MVCDRRGVGPYALPSLGGPGNIVVHISPGNSCKCVQFGAFWGHQVIKSEMENRHCVPLLKVGWNLLSLLYHIASAAPARALYMVMDYGHMVKR